MTLFEYIKQMDVIDMAIYINKLQLRAVEDYENGFFPKGYFDNITMLESEYKEVRK